MSERPAFTVTPRLVFGLVLVVLGTTMTLGNLGYDLDLLEYWPVALIAVGVVKLATGSFSSGIFWVLTGGLFLIPKVSDEVDLGDLWPAFLILLGLHVVSRSFGAKREAGRRRREAGRRDADEADSTNLFALLSSHKRKIESRRFRGGDVVAILGGCELDLTQAELAGGAATVDALAMWGGIDIRVPNDWNVVLEVTPVMGGAEDNRGKDDAAVAVAVSDGDRPTLTVKGLALMGGVDVRG